MLLDITEYKDINEIIILGDILFENRIIDKVKAVELISDLYSKYGYNFTDQLSGCYSIIIFDKRKVFVLKSEFGSSKEIYYVKNNDGIFLSDKLHEIISVTKAEKASPNIQNVFLKYGFIPHKNTLIKDVYKVPNGYTFIFESDTGTIVEHKNVSRKFDVVSSDNEKTRYVDLLRNSIVERISDMSINATTLSGGYDSNLLLYLFRQSYEGKISAFSVGGSVGRNECGKARIIANTYKKVVFYEGVVDSKALNCYDEIVWRLEGNIYERGIFLQYVLGKIVSGNNIRNMIAGDGADQVMSANYSNELDPNEIRLWKKCPKTALQYIVIPKSIKMMNSFGVNIFYPFLNPDVMSALYAVKHLNGICKTHHMETVKRLVGDTIAEQLENVGGTTNLITLFDNEYSYIKAPHVRQQINECEKRKDVKSLEWCLDDYLKKEYLDIFYSIFLDKKQIEHYIVLDKL